VSRLVLLGAAALLGVLPCGAASAEAPGKTATAGAGFSVGAGHQYPWVGLNVAYYVPIPDSRFWLTPYFGAGGGVCTGESTSSCATGGAVGAMGAWGRTHRIIVDVFYSAIGAISPNLHGTYLPVVPVYGVGVAAGYEYMARSGFFLRGDLGVAYATSPPLALGEMTLVPTATLIGLGYKLW